MEGNLIQEIISILRLFGSLALFLYGMKVMSEAIQRLAGLHIRKFFKKFLTNRFTTFSFGFIITALFQSSSAISVIAISMVDAGILSLMESVGIILGTNVGTTITGWLVAVGVEKFSMSDYALPLLTVGLLLLFKANWRFRSAGEFVIGFCLLFLGIYFIKQTLLGYGDDSFLYNYLDMLSSGSLMASLVGLVIGFLLTLVFQSSSAAIALIIVLISKDLLTVHMGCVLILGSNVGTTLTAEISGLIAGNDGRILARSHSLFNIIGCIWAFFMIKPFLQALEFVGGFIAGESMDASYVLAAFHTSFNVLNALLFFPFMSFLIKLAERTILRTHTHKPLDLQRINVSPFNTPEILLMEVQKDLQHFIQITTKMLGFVEKILFEINDTQKGDLILKVRELEKETDVLDLEIRAYLMKISKSELSSGTAKRIHQFNVISLYLEELADNYLHVIRNTRQKNKKNVWFNQKQRNQIRTIFENLNACNQIMAKNITSMDYDLIESHVARVAEEKLDGNYKKFHKQNLANIEMEDTNYMASIYFSQLLMLLEINGDIMYKISKTIEEG